MSGYSIGVRSSVDLSFCRFHSNWPSNTVWLDSASLPEVHRCLEFYNNSADSSVSPAARCLISIVSGCEFHDCLFIRNAADTLLSANGGDPVVILKRCIFDVLPVFWTLDGAVQTASCMVDPDLAIGFVPASCPVSIATNPFTTMWRRRPRMFMHVLIYSLSWPF
jgi:hypothetical protein